MKIDFEQIKELLQTENLAEVSRKIGIPYRTLQDWKLENNKWLKQAEERLAAMQNYINDKEELATAVGKNQFIEDAKAEIKRQYYMDDPNEFEYEYKLTELEQILYVKSKGRTIAEVSKSHKRDMLNFYDNLN